MAEAHPEPGHGANMAARAYLRRLSLIGPAGEPRLLDDAAAALAEVVTAAEQQPGRTPAPSATAGQAPAIPGYPKRLEGDLQAAAQWRLISPAARRAAEQTMDRLICATTVLAEATAAADVHQPFSPQQDAALLSRGSLHQDLEELTARHALLMHAGVLADAEAAAEPAKHAAVVAAAQATEVERQPGTAAEMAAARDAFMVHVNEAEDRIAKTLTEQRRLTVEALGRIFPYAVTSTGRHTVRRNLLENSGLGLDAYHQGYRAMRAPAGLRVRKRPTAAARCPSAARPFRMTTSSRPAQRCSEPRPASPTCASAVPTPSAHSGPSTAQCITDRLGPRRRPHAPPGSPRSPGTHRSDRARRTTHPARRWCRGTGSPGPPLLRTAAAGRTPSLTAQRRRPHPLPAPPGHPVRADTPAALRCEARRAPCPPASGQVPTYRRPAGSGSGSPRAAF
ncbi:hypothetical protein ABT272_30040 [Streptomyces sp900105245]|uniref:DUF222 domain-containing protein n=1 Tax=Streptomyces sp. 900105245 TaxID=3154379 RepID=A0ABV1UFB8_9ACTN